MEFFKNEEFSVEISLKRLIKNLYTSVSTALHIQKILYATDFVLSRVIEVIFIVYLQFYNNNCPRL